MPDYLRAIELIPNQDPEAEWPWLGFRFAGGEVGLGQRISRLRLRPQPGSRGAPPNSRAKLGSIMLVAGGVSSRLIGERPEIGVSASSVNNYVEEACREVAVGQRHMLFPALLRNSILAIESNGPFANFQPDVRTLIMYGLLSRGVQRSYVTAAFRLKAQHSLDKIIAAQVELEGDPRESGKTQAAITAGLITGQLGRRTSVPLLYPNRTPDSCGEPQPIVETRDWGRLVAVRNRAAFVAMFESLSLDQYRQFSAVPANPALV